MNTERRIIRSNVIPLALQLQLSAAASRFHLAAALLTDEQGLIISSTGHADDLEEVATLAPKLLLDAPTWQGVVTTEEGPSVVTARRIEIPYGSLCMLGIGGFGPGIQWELHHSAKGVARILS